VDFSCRQPQALTYLNTDGRAVDTADYGNSTWQITPRPPAAPAAMCQTSVSLLAADQAGELFATVSGVYTVQIVPATS
jgi:hypothetical protein